MVLYMKFVDSFEKLILIVISATVNTASEDLFCVGCTVEGDKTEERPLDQQDNF